jgi:hypothetical protein
MLGKIVGILVPWNLLREDERGRFVARERRVFGESSCGRIFIFLALDGVPHRLLVMKMDLCRFGLLIL